MTRARRVLVMRGAGSSVAVHATGLFVAAVAQSLVMFAANGLLSEPWVSKAAAVLCAGAGSAHVVDALQHDAPSR